MSEGHPNWKCHPIIQYFIKCFPRATCISIMCRTLKMLRFRCPAAAPGPREGGSLEEQPWNVHVSQTAPMVLRHINVLGICGYFRRSHMAWCCVSRGWYEKSQQVRGVQLPSCARSCRVNMLPNAKWFEPWRLLNGEAHGFASSERLMFQLHLQWHQTSYPIYFKPNFVFLIKKSVGGKSWILIPPSFSMKAKDKRVTLKVEHFAKLYVI